MAAYSTDLRERVVRAYEKGDGSTRQLACRYEVRAPAFDADATPHCSCNFAKPKLLKQCSFFQPNLHKQLFLQ